MTQPETPKAGEYIRQGEQKLLNEEWAEALGDFEQAVALLQQAKEPAMAHLAETQNGRGAALLQLGRYQEAINALRQAIVYQPDLAGAYFNLGLAYEGLDDSDQAIKVYSKAAELTPDDAEIYFRRGGIYFGREEFAKTVEDTSRAIELHPEGSIVAPYIARGLAYYRLEQYDKAAADFSEAMKSDPRSAAEAFFYRALVFIDKEDALSARADLQAYLLMSDDLDSPMAQQAREIIEELDKLQ